MLLATLLLSASAGCTRSETSPTVSLPAPPPRLFSSDSAWNSPIRANPSIAGNSAVIVKRLAGGDGAIANLYRYGTPVFDADAATPRHRVRCTAAWGTCDLEKALVPIPANALTSPGSDSAFVVIDWTTRTSYEFWRARAMQDGSWTAVWGRRASIDGDGRHGATGAGVSLLAGLIRQREVGTGTINHALAVSSRYTCRDTWVFPAVKTDGSYTGRDCIPMGSRLQLDPALDIAALGDLSPAEREVAVALQRYGAYVRNSSGADLAFAFEHPTAEPDDYQSVGLRRDYAPLSGIPLDRLRVLAPP